MEEKAMTTITLNAIVRSVLLLKTFQYRNVEGFVVSNKGYALLPPPYIFKGLR